MIAHLLEGLLRIAEAVTGHFKSLKCLDHTREHLDDYDLTEKFVSTGVDLAYDTLFIKLIEPDRLCAHIVLQNCSRDGRWP